MFGSELTRIGVSLPQSLLVRFDDIISKRGYSSRSEGIRDAIRAYLNYYEWMEAVEGERIGVITMVYDHHKRGILEELTELQHEELKTIHTTMHIHLDVNNCLEVIILKGDSHDVKRIAETIMALKGVKYVGLTTTVPNP
ncbi:MAG: nickel-responsive transcriptional regulator NikR [Methermicoccaceae archaeon]